MNDLYSVVNSPILKNTIYNFVGLVSNLAIALTPGQITLNEALSVTPQLQVERRLLLGNFDPSACRIYGNFYGPNEPGGIYDTPAVTEHGVSYSFFIGGIDPTIVVYQLNPEDAYKSSGPIPSLPHNADLASQTTSTIDAYVICEEEVGESMGDQPGKAASRGN
jgi:hypothetical protein